MRRRLLDGVEPETPEVTSTVANLCDVVFYDTSTGKIDCVPNADIGSVASTYKPIGIVVIPQSHDVYGDGSCCVMALKPMSCKTPTSGHVGGDTTYACVEFGGYMGAINAGVEANAQTLITTITATTTMQYMALTSLTPPPYIMDGGVPTENKYDAFFVRDHAFNKFGPSTHNKLIAKADTTGVDWRNIPDSRFSSNLGDATFYAGPLCAARYMTPYDTTIENWYYPDNGEIIYIWSQAYKIKNTMSMLNTTYGNIFAVVGFQTHTFSPFLYNNNRGYYLYFYSSMFQNTPALSAQRCFFHSTQRIPIGMPLPNYNMNTSAVGLAYPVRKMKFEEKTS